MTTLNYGGVPMTVDELVELARALEVEAKKKRELAMITVSYSLRTEYEKQASAREEEASAIRRFIKSNR